MYTIKKNFFYLAIMATVATFMNSCAPVVRTAVVKTYPAVAQDSVTVYWERSEVPKNSEELGSIVVTDGGTTLRCDSLTVINLVKLEAGKMGGNATLITEHRHPSFWTSSCHRMAAIALNVSDSPILRSDTSTSRESLPKPPRTQSRVRFVANFGYGFRTAQINPDLSHEERKDIEQRKSGLAWDVQAAYYTHEFLGIGLDYCGYYATSSSPVYLTVPPYISGILNTADMMTYIGPVFIARAVLKKWIFDCSVSLGYLRYMSKGSLHDYTASSIGHTFGSKLSFGASYKLDEQFEIGANMGMLEGTLSKFFITNFDGTTQTLTLDAKQREGLGQFRLLVGIRYNIK